MFVFSVRHTQEHPFFECVVITQHRSLSNFVARCTAEPGLNKVWLSFSERIHAGPQKEANCVFIGFLRDDTATIELSEIFRNSGKKIYEEA